MAYKIILKRKGTEEIIKVFGCDNHFNAQQIYNFLQENDNKNNDFYVFIVSSY